LIGAVPFVPRVKNTEEEESKRAQNESFCISQTWFTAGCDAQLKLGSQAFAADKNLSQGKSGDQLVEFAVTLPILIVVAAQRLRLFSRRRKWFAVFPKGLAFNHSAAMKDEGSKTRRITVAISDLQSKAKKLREDLDQLEGKTPRKRRSKGKRSRT